MASGKDDVSEGTKFIAGDCRSVKYDPTVVTRELANGLVQQWQDEMLPVETKEFSTAPAKDGTVSLGQFEALGVDFRGTGDSTVTLVDNVRDENSTTSRTTGPMSRVLRPDLQRADQPQRHDNRPVRLGAPHRCGPEERAELGHLQQSPGRPRMYEAVFAHEYQHLLHSYLDAAETTWLNEGLSDMAPSLVGYSDARRRINQTRAESHIFCYQGYGLVKGSSNPNPNACGGPQNSLTLWNDEGPGSEVLADYGNAWSFMLYLYDHYGTKFISELHRDGANQGLASVQAALDKFAKGKKVMDVVADYQISTLLDRLIEEKGYQVTGADNGIRDLVEPERLGEPGDQVGVPPSCRARRRTPSTTSSCGPARRCSRATS